MKLRQALIAGGVVAVIMAVIDAAWIGLVANSFYREQLGPLLGPTVAWAAALFYVIYAGAVVYFAVRPALQSDSLKLGILNGSLLGLVAYGTYDLTNMATLQGWPLPLVFVDMAWGIVLTASVTALSFVVIKSTFIGKFYNGKE